MSSIYFDETYLSNAMGAGELAGCLTSGGTTSATTGSVLSQFISGACSYVDSSFQTAGIPIPASAEPLVKDLACYVCVERLYLKASKTPPERISFMIDDLCDKIATGARQVPGQDVNVIGAAAGGHTTSPNSTSTSSHAGVFKRSRLWQVF